MSRPGGKIKSGSMTVKKESLKISLPPPFSVRCGRSFWRETGQGEGVGAEDFKNLKRVDDFYHARRW